MSAISVFRQHSEAFSVLMLIKDRLIKLHGRMVDDRTRRRARDDVLIFLTTEAIGYLRDGRTQFALHVLEEMHVELSK